MKERKIELACVEYEDGEHPAFPGGVKYSTSVPVSCATCRWAVARTYAHESPPLWCTKMGGGDMLHGGREAPKPPPDAPAMVEVSEYGGFFVQPSFGCTEWQAKDDPASEAP